MHLAQKILSMRTERFDLRQQFRATTRRAVAHAKYTEDILARATDTMFTPTTTCYGLH